MTTRCVSADTGSNYRTRLFWKLQAWRLRKSEAPESSRSVSLFSNFSALDHRGYADAVCELLPSLSDEASGLAPISAAQVRQRLRRELGLQSCASILANESGAVGGYAWGRITTAGEALDTFRHMPSLAGLDVQDWTRLQSLLGGKPRLVLYDIGLAANYRYGFSPLKLLLKPLFELGLNCHVRQAFWWAPRQSAMYDISVAFGARSVLVKGSAVFFVHDDIASIARVLALLPSGDISDLLARVGPPRRPRIRVTALPAETASRLQLQNLVAPSPGAQPTRIVSDAIASNDDAAGDSAADSASGEPLLPQLAEPLAEQNAIAESASPPAARAGTDNPLLHQLPARLAALFPRLAG